MTGGDSGLWRHSISAHAGDEGAVVDAIFPGCLSRRHLFAVNGNDKITGHVVGLCQLVTPTTVPWLIVASVVDAIKCVPRGPLTHLSEKHREVLSPLRAHRNSACAVLGVCLEVRVVTTPPSTQPRAELWGQFPAGRVPVAAISCAPDFTLKAATAACVSVSERTSCHHSGLAAVAKAIPRDSCRALSKTHNNETSESLSNQINQPHGLNYRTGHLLHEGCKS